MQAGSISRRYARGIFELAREAGTVEATGRDLESFVGQLKASPELERLFSSPTYGADAQVEVVRKLLAGRVSALTHSFLMLLASRHRMAILPDIIREYSRLRDEEEGIVRVHIKSATPLSQETEDRLVTSLRERIGKKIAVTREVDPSLIGGLVTQVGNVVFDGSIATQFSKIKRHLEQGDSL